MRSRSSIWFECKVRYEKTMEDGMTKKVVETYTVDALSFGEAEKRIIEEMEPYVGGEVDIVDLKIAQYKEIFFADSDLADKWYKAKLAFITLDEVTDREKKTSTFYLVNAGNMDSAIKNINSVMGSTLIDYQTMTVSETNIMDVFEYKKAGQSENIVDGKSKAASE